MEKEIKITLSAVTKNGMVAGMGSCTPDEAWLVPHVKAIAEDYAKSLASQSDLTRKIVKNPAPAPKKEGTYCPECEYAWDEEDIVYNRDGDPICPDCKAELEHLLTCPHCGEPVPTNMRLKNTLTNGTEVEYCPECGVLVDEDEWE